MATQHQQQRLDAGQQLQSDSEMKLFFATAVLIEQTLMCTSLQLARVSLSTPGSPLTRLSSILAAAGVVASSGGEAHPGGSVLSVECVEAWQLHLHLHCAAGPRFTPNTPPHFSSHAL